MAASIFQAAIRSRRYYVNRSAQTNGDHEVHQWEGIFNCPHPAALLNREDLGWHLNCHNAVQQARRLGYGTANGCFYCARECHTG